jgi:hypothetical protein
MQRHLDGDLWQRLHQKWVATIRALIVLDGTVPAGVGHVPVDDQAFVLARVGVGEPFAGRSDVNILLGHITEVLSAEAAAVSMSLVGSRQREQHQRKLLLIRRWLRRPAIE